MMFRKIHLKSSISSLRCMNIQKIITPSVIYNNYPYLHDFIIASSLHCTICTYARPCGTARFCPLVKTCSFLHILSFYKRFFTLFYGNDIIDVEARERMKKRHIGIIVNEKGIGNFILPGDYVIKTDPRTCTERKVRTERSFGYFWMLKVRFYLEF